MAYRVHQGVSGGIRITNGYEGCFHAMVMIESGGVKKVRCVVEKTTGYTRGDLDWLTDRTSCSISLECISNEKVLLMENTVMYSE